MKNFLKLGLLALLSTFLITSCEEDLIGTGGGGTGGGGGTTGDNPELVLVTEAGFISEATTIEAGSSFAVKVQAAKGTADLQAFEILEDGVRIATDRISFINEVAPTSSAPLVGLTETSSLEWVIEMVAHSDLSERNYEFRIIDTAGNSAKQGVFINTDTTPTEVIPPTITILGSGTFSVDPSTKVGVDLNVVGGSSKITFLTIFDGNNDPVAVDRLWIGDSDTPISSNPLEIPAADADGFETKIFIRSNNTFGSEVYKVIISTEDEEIYFEEITIDTGIAGVSVTELSGVLFNSGGPAGSGGLDLDDGIDTGSSDVISELKDEGIDQSQSTANNWIQRMSGINGTEIRQMIVGENGLQEGFSFDVIATDNQLAELWGNGVTLSAVNSSGNLTTGIVQVGDVYLAFRDGKYYAFTVTNINVTADDNKDSYTLDIKH